MADNIANILMRLTGESDDAEDTLERFLRKVQAFGKTEATAEANVSVGDGEFRLLALMTQLASFAQIDATAEASVDVDEGGLAGLAASLEAFAQKGINLDVDVQEEAALVQFASLIAAAETVSNKEVEVDVDTTNLQALIVLLNTLRAQGTDVTLGLDTTEARTQLAAFLLATKALVQDLDPTLELDTDEALARIVAFTAAAEATDIDIPLTVKEQGALAQLAVINAAVEAVSNQDAEIEVDTTNLQSLLTILNRLTSEDRDITVGTNTEKGQAELVAFLIAAQGLMHDINVDAEVNTAGALSDLATLATAIQVVDGQDIDIDADVGKVSIATLLMTKLASVMGGAVGGFQKVGSAIGGVTVNLGPFGVKLTAVTGAVIALAIAMAVSLVAALSLLVSSLASATAAVVGLATALVGALGPAVAVIVATISRITKIVSAIKAKTEADKASAAGSAQAASAEEQRHDALLAVAGAIRNVTGAERGLQQATDAARDAIVQANRDEAAASRALGDASEEVADQFVEAHKAMKQSVEDVKDALLNLEGAEIGIDKTAIATERAKIKLAKLRDAAGATGREFDAAFNKLEDVDIQFDDSQLKGILEGGTSGGATSQLDIADAILDVREAKLNEKRATKELADSEQDLSEKRQRAAEFAREGISAYKPYTAALQAQSDASERLALATERSNKLEQQGIDNAPAVLAATESLRDANDRLAEARHNAANAAEGAAGGAAAKKAKQEWNALTEAEKLFGDALIATGAALRTSFQPAVEGMLSGLGGALSKVPAILAPLTGSFTSLGDAMGKSVNSFAGLLATPEMSDSFITLIDGATQLAQILGARAFQAFFQIMTNIATAAMPLLIDASSRFAGWLERIAGQTSNQKRLGAGFQSLGEHLFGILRLIKAISNIFIGFFSATSGQAKSFVGTLTGMAQGLADFFNSAEGQEKIKQFFADVIPLAIQSGRFIFNVITIVLQLVQILAPALTGVLSVFNFLLGVLRVILSVFRPFLQVAGQIALLFGGGLPAAVGKFLAKFSFLKGIGSILTKSIGGTVTTIISRMSFLVSTIPGIFKPMLDFILGIVRKIGQGFDGLVGWVSEAMQNVIKAIEGLGKGFFNAGKALVQNIIDGIKSLAKDIGGVAGKVFGFLVDKLPGSEPKDKSSPFAGLGERGRAIIENIAGGIPQGSAALSEALHSSIVPVLAGIDTNVRVPTGTPAMAGAAVGGGVAGPVTNNYIIQSPAGSLPDAEATVQAIARRNERKGGGSPRA